MPSCVDCVRPSVQVMVTGCADVKKQLKEAQQKSAAQDSELSTTKEQLGSATAAKLELQHQLDSQDERLKQQESFAQQQAEDLKQQNGLVQQQAADLQSLKASCEEHAGTCASLEAQLQSADEQKQDVQDQLEDARRQLESSQEQLTGDSCLGCWSHVGVRVQFK